MKFLIADDEDSLDSMSESSFGDEDLGLKSILPSDESKVKEEVIIIIIMIFI